MTDIGLDLLLSRTQVGKLSLNNRMIMAPMTRSRAGAGDAATPLMAEYYSQRASAGLIISEGSQVSAQGKGYLRTPGIFTPEQITGWKQVTDAVHAEGGQIFLQLWHVGRLSHPLVQVNGAQPVAPSAIKADGEIYTPKGSSPMNCHGPWRSMKSPAWSPTSARPRPTRSWPALTVWRFMAPTAT